MGRTAPIHGRHRAVHHGLAIQLFIFLALVKVLAAAQQVGPAGSDSVSSEAERSGTELLCALCITVRDLQPRMWMDFLCHHISLGFDRIFVFFDETEPSLSLLEATFSFGDVISVMKSGEDLKAMWKNTTIWSKMSSHLDEVMVRQVRCHALVKGNKGFHKCVDMTSAADMYLWHFLSATQGVSVESRNDLQGKEEFA